MRLAIIGNSGGGKSTLARRLAEERGLPLHEIDRLLWRPGWTLAPEADYEAAHTRILAQPAWLIEGVGRFESIARRLERATHLVLIDMPLWQHFWLAAERQIAWSKGALHDRPGDLAEAPPTRTLFETIWTIDREWMPAIRALTAQAAARGAEVARLDSPEAVERFHL